MKIGSDCTNSSLRREFSASLHSVLYSDEVYFPWDMICINCGLTICIQAVNYNFNFVFPQCKDSTFTTEAFLLTIKTAANINELEAMIEIVDHEIYKQRSRDTNRLIKDGKKIV